MVATIYYNTTTTPKLMILLYFFINISRPTILSPNDRLSPPHRTASPFYPSFSPPVFGWLLCVSSSNGGVLIKWRPSNLMPFHNIPLPTISSPKRTFTSPWLHHLSFLLSYIPPPVFGWLLCVSTSNGGRPSNNIE